MLNQFSRTELIIGKENIDKLRKSKVVLFGIGGVGSYVLEGLVRAGIGHFVLVDDDTVSVTNINRQIIATTKTIGKNKVDIAKERVLDINPDAIVETKQMFFLPETEDFFDSSIDYIIDAVDTVTAKLEIIERAKKHNIPVISCMGTGNKLDPTRFEVTDISKTKICPLAKAMRKNLKKRGINHVKVVYSQEEPITPSVMEEKEEAGHSKRVTPGSISFVPSVAGLICVGEVVKDIINNRME